MLISDKVRSAINQQIGNEFGASLQYVSIAAFFANEGLLELSDFFFKQSDEERDHAMRFVRYVIDSGGQVEVPQVSAPKNVFKSVEEAMRLSLDHEKEVTKQINGLVEIASNANDHITQNFLSWFLEEQLEEYATMETLLKVAQRAGENVLQVEDYVVRHRSKLGVAAAKEAE